MTAVLMLDFYLPDTTAIATLYIGNIMITMWLPRTNSTFIFTGIVALLIILIGLHKFDQTSHWFDIINRTLAFLGIWFTCLLVIIRKKLARTVAIKQEQLEAIIDAAIDPFVATDHEGRIFLINHAVETVFGWTEHELIGRNVNILMPAPYRDKHDDYVHHYHKTGQSKVIGVPREFKAVRKDGSVFPCEVSIGRTDFKFSEEVYMATIRDITDRKHLENKLVQMSIMDELTQIYNRRYFNIQIEKEWHRAGRDQHPLSILILDIDYFKKYNDHFGHLGGDECLKKIAKTLSDSLRRASDMIARYGGEEFIVILPNTNSQHAKVTADTLKKSIEDLRLEHPDGINKIVTLSIGLSTATPNGEASATELIQNADQALYDAKENGRNQIVIFDKNQ